ncbi:alpha-hydroxy acid oxidase [Falsigemmobacter faecalis]|uniref:Alpha-hydroxy-acid oxidizing protein n=1 Tax=Falsigemmobacter faecalis TaxID=2488730 RepID=A0A3P3DPN6_9RHOB|nr:alpha-hydroxy acid oxidase [Falsigemmobacter faecalis]RRH76237.1 alpha-hydroxy-acid oxidizing protein [Falsigemmobacter faecalis]
MAQIPPDVVSLADYARHAALILPEDRRAYIDGAAADGLTQQANASAWQAIRLSGRVLRDMRGASTALELLGLRLAHPLILAPVAFHALAHPDGEHATALGAAAAEAVMTVSTEAGLSLEEIASRAQGPLWFQLYMQPRRADTLQLMRRAEAAGYRALVVTLDAPVNGFRNAEVRAGFRLPEGLRAVNLDGMKRAEILAKPGRAVTFLGLLDQAPRWEDLHWLITESRLPVLVKGIMTPEDAVVAAEAGAAGIVVSNHGGRVLDTLPATAEALPRIATALGGRIPVICDGGLRRGTDVLKALALGATAVMIGRPQLHALSLGGAAGVAHMLSILRAELEVAMALTGVAQLSQADAGVLWPRGASQGSDPTF